MATAFQCLVICLSCFRGATAGPVKRTSAPSVIQQSNAPAGVPDFVIKYGTKAYFDFFDKNRANIKKRR
jgi:hypothetical protein